MPHLNVQCIIDARPLPRLIPALLHLRHALTLLLFVNCCNDTLQEGQMEESDDDDSDLDEDFGVGKSPEVGQLHKPDNNYTTCEKNQLQLYT